MKILLSLCFCSCIIFVSPIFALANSIGTYEVSYITNSVDSEDSWGSNKPAEALSVGMLGPGEYELQIMEGRLDGNTVNSDHFNNHYRNIDEYWTVIQTEINPGYQKYDSGFNGGNTAPATDTGHNTPNEYNTNWNWGTSYWLGDSLNDPNGIKGSHGGWIGRTKTFELESETSLWFFWDDYWNHDNIGGVTIALSRISENPVPAPTTVMLLGIGLLGLAGVSRKKLGK